jgi:transcriptional regulator NrdR family protein
MHILIYRIWIILHPGIRMTTIVKRDSKRERFEESKIKRSIEAAARDARLPEDRVKRLAEGASRNIIQFARNEKEIRTATIREIVLDKLDLTAPEVSKAWRDYDRRTKGLT